MVGILLPPSIAGAMVNFAALLSGKVPVNLNYTVANEALESCARQCELQTVITSKAFLERVPLQVPGRTVLLEEIAESPRTAEKLAAFLDVQAKDAEFVLFGVVTEYCVRFAAKGLLERGRRVSLVRDAIETLKAEDGQKAIGELISLTVAPNLST